MLSLHIVFLVVLNICRTDFPFNIAAGDLEDEGFDDGVPERDIVAAGVPDRHNVTYLKDKETSAL